MASTSDFRNGLCLRFNNDIYSIVSFQHVKPGKGGAFVRTKLKSMTNGKVIDNTFNAGTKVDAVRVERRTHQYLYKDGSDYHFMDIESFESIAFASENFSDGDLLKEGQKVDILLHEDKVLTFELPTQVVLKIKYTEPGLKGDTATNTLKQATTETGAKIQVPLFVNIGDLVRIDTRTRKYQERVKHA